MAKNFEQLERTGAVLYGDAGNMFVMVIHAKPQAADMLRARPALATMARRVPRGFPALTWVTRSAGLSMDSDARRAATEVTEEFTKQIVAQGTVIEGTGFQAATVRAIVMGLDAMVRSACPKKTFAELAAAVEWCATRRPAGLEGDSLAELTQAIAQAREGLKA